MNIVRKSVLSILLLSVVVAGCKKNDDNPTSSEGAIPAAMVGSWTPTSASLNGAAIEPAQFFSYEQGAVTSKFTFNADGSYTYAELDSSNKVIYSEGGTATVNGQNFTITASTSNGQPLNPPVVIAGTYALASNQLTISINIPQIGTAVVVMKK